MKEGGRSEDETMDLIMHACFLIHCSGGKGRRRGGRAGGVQWDVGGEGGRPMTFRRCSPPPTHKHTHSYKRTRSSLGASRYRLMR